MCQRAGWRLGARRESDFIVSGDMDRENNGQTYVWQGTFGCSLLAGQFARSKLRCVLRAHDLSDEVECKSQRERRGDGWTKGSKAG